MTTIDPAAPGAAALAIARALGSAVLTVGDGGRIGAAVDADGPMRDLEQATQDATAVIELARDGLMRVAGAEHQAHSGALGALASAMRARGIGALTLRPGASRDELQRVVAFLSAQRPDQPPASWGVHLVPATSAGWTASRAFDAAYEVEPAALLVATRAALGDGNAMALAACARALAASLERVGTGGGRLTLAQVGRLLARPAAVTLLARYVTDGAGDHAIHAALARAGDFAVRILLEALADADTLAARRACFDAIAAIDLGTGPLLDALRDERWFVVRNAALLLGEVDAPGTEAALAGAMGHTDVRVRLAVAGALLKRRTPAALAAVQRAVRDTSPLVRQLAARAYAVGADARPSSAPLITALDLEGDERVAREQVTALGRLATPDAIQRLVRMLTPGTTNTPSAALQVAAMEALVAARGDAAVVTLKRLVDVPDPDVRAAARGFLKAVGDR
ncbi:MAG: HEAT repeat domain-containing protein [Gemmatimonadaceae bacterium]|nr:HEAT repeat domain-containing protein [Gemmatimonadaceae bacterium]